jgi:hypothetical protein
MEIVNSKKWVVQKKIAATLFAINSVLSIYIHWGHDNLEFFIGDIIIYFVIGLYIRVLLEESCREMSLHVPNYIREHFIHEKEEIAKVSEESFKTYKSWVFVEKIAYGIISSLFLLETLNLLATKHSAINVIFLLVEIINTV